MKTIYILILIFTINKIYSQTDGFYEKIAFDFFIKEIIDKEYKNVKYFKYSGKIDLTSYGFSDCLPVSGINSLITTIDPTLNVKSNNLFVKEISLIKKIFVSNSKIKELHIFKSFVTSQDATVCILVISKSFEEYFSIKIGTRTNKVEDYCKTVMVE